MEFGGEELGVAWRTLSSFESDTSTTRERVNLCDFPTHSLALRACKKTLGGTGSLPIFSKVNFVRQARPGEGSQRKIESRRSWIATCVAAATALAARTTIADDAIRTLYLADDVDRAVARGVDFLTSFSKQDGQITDRGHHVAMTSLAIMAMAAIGTDPSEETDRGIAMRRAVDFVLQDKHQTREGYFGGSDGSRMYGHGITTLMLTEILGMGATAEQNEKIHHALTKALGLILEAQKVSKPTKLRGGWRYTPTSTDSDLSVSVWQLMALRSAKNDGLDVPAEAIASAIGYLENSYASPRNADGSPRNRISGFSYTPGTHHPSFTMTAAGMLAMQVCGQYDSPFVAGASKWLMQNPPRESERFFFYGIYYYAQAMHQAGDKYAEHADALVPKLLLHQQRGDGSWISRSGEEKNLGVVYATALAVLSLSVRYHYLPIYQR